MHVPPLKAKVINNAMKCTVQQGHLQKCNAGVFATVLTLADLAASSMEMASGMSASVSSTFCVASFLSLSKSMSSRALHFDDRHQHSHQQKNNAATKRTGLAQTSSDQCSRHTLVCPGSQCQQIHVPLRTSADALLTRLMGRV